MHSTKYVAGVLFALAGLPAGAASVAFQEGVSPTAGYGHVAQDFRGNGTINNGADTLVGNQPGGVGVLRTALGFNLSSLPAGSQITAVELLLTVNNTGNGTISGLGTIEIREAVPNGNPANNMVENQVTITSWATGSNWTTSGGDFGPTLSTGTVLDSNANNTFENGETATFASTAAWVTAAQNAFNTGQPLEMILLSPTAEANSSGPFFARFGSDAAPTLGNRPLLSVTYFPEPGVAGVIVIAAAGLLGRRRRR